MKKFTIIRKILPILAVAGPSQLCQPRLLASEKRQALDIRRRKMWAESWLKGTVQRKLRGVQNGSN
jgi:hypothetical protein